MGLLSRTIVRRSFLTEIQFTATPTAGSQWKFGENPVFTTPEMMQQIYVYGLETVYDTVCPASPTGRPVVTQAGLARCLVNLKVGGKEDVKDYPGLYLMTLLNGGILREFRPMLLNFSECYLRITENATPTITSGMSALINVIYCLKSELATVHANMNRGAGNGK